jgi:hypothetical protein
MNSWQQSQDRISATSELIVTNLQTMYPRESHEYNPPVHFPMVDAKK